jgi:uncharacterized protein (TIGR02271 family)
MFDKSEISSVIGQTLYTDDGTKIGKIGQVYVDEVHDQPEWVTVNTGLFGTNESFVPLAEASWADDGLRVPYNKSTIKDAPNVSSDGHLSEAEERELYDHYSVPYTTEGSTFADTSRLGGDTSGTTATTGQYQNTDASDRNAYAQTSGTGQTRGTGQTGRTGQTGQSGSDGMTRSEEQLNVGTEQVQAGRARLRKWVDTETQQVEVPVRTEKAQLVTEPITDDNRGDAFDGPAISEGEHEVVLNTERPVVDVEAVPVERVRLDKTVEESRETVAQDVRKERIDLDDETRRDRATTQNRRR